MPKSSKKRKEKAADFSKAKLKLGKGKAAAANAVDTSFKARSIALPSQSITAENDDNGAPKTRRNLSIDELFVQLRHYSATVRRDAISGLKELLKAHPQLLESSLTQTLRSCAPLVTDEDTTVRKALLSFFSWFFESTSADTMRPHAPVVLLFVTSAQTHIFPEIRVDGVRFLDVLLASVPDVVTRGWSDEATANTGSAADGRRVLSGYLALLNASSSRGESKDAPSASGAVLSPASRLLVLRSLSVFMRHAVGEQCGSSAIPTWFFASSFNTRQGYESFVELLHQSPSDQPVTTWRTEVEGHDDDDDGRAFLAADNASSWEFSLLTEAVDAACSTQANAVSNSSTSRTAALAHSLQPMLTAAFLEGAPSLTAIQARVPPSVHMDIDTVVVVAEIMRTLYVHIFRSEGLRVDELRTALSDLQSVLGYMETYFPFHVGGGNDYQLSTSAQRLNLIYCELTGLCALGHNASAAVADARSRPHGKGKQRRRPLEITSQVERISDFVIGLLDTSKVGNTLSADAYRSLLPSIWSLLNSSDLALAEDSGQDDIFAATVWHAIQCSSTGPVKPLATAFVASLLLLQHERQYNGSFLIPSSLPPQVQRWLAELPKLCWELGDSNLALTELILTFLLRFSQRSNQPSSVYGAVTARMCPYFMVSHQTRGKLPGPFTKLELASCARGSGSLSRLALDAATTLARHGESDDLRAAVTWAVSGMDDAVSIL
ncbi:hypothetical protein AURDEDRAFT_181478 [Auricularia subglabra TFB-10046 SS5]|nr:hypothetical protein AURDEDRAFT_181478 [Auricularia subglabra TFB-10046 SS5]